MSMEKFIFSRKFISEFHLFYKIYGRKRKKLFVKLGFCECLYPIYPIWYSMRPAVKCIHGHEKKTNTIYEFEKTHRLLAGGS